MRYLLDTHALVWGAKWPERLSVAARRIIGSLPEETAVCDVSLQEIGLLLHFGKIDLEGRAADVLGPLLKRLTVLPITLDAAIAAPALGLPHGDQFDRIITATAKILGLQLVTKDGNITDAGIVRVVW